MDAEHLPGGPSVISRPLLSKTEATLLNLIRLAVQDNYLVFAKLPLTSVISITEEEEAARRTILKSIRRVRVDVSLVHPGTLCSMKVIQFVEEEESPTQAKERDRVVDTMFASSRDRDGSARASYHLYRREARGPSWVRRAGMKANGSFTFQVPSFKQDGRLRRF